MVENKPSPSGFSLIEAMISMAVGGVFLASVLAAWQFSTKTWKEESVQSLLRVSIEQSMEKIKEDIRLSDANKILFYPSSGSPYAAISIPRATPATSGFLTLSGGNIAWDKTVVYHMFTTGGKTELRRTVYNTFDSNTTTRQAELNTLVTTGAPSGGSSATTRVLFKNDTAAFEIVSPNPMFDGYAASVSRSPLTSFGSVYLTSGAHQVTFEVMGKNSSSSSYRLGVDSLALSPSGCHREAEILAVSSSTGQAQNTENMTLYSGVWGGNYQKEYQATASGNSITFTVNYDEWIESNFNNMTHSTTETTGTNPVLALASRETQGLTASWLASTQTLSGSQVDEILSQRQSIRSVVSGAYLTKSAHMIRLKFTAAQSASLVVNAAYFGLRQGSQALATGTFNFSGVPTQLYFDNAPLTEGSTDPVGAVGVGLATSITVPAGNYVWTNWFTYTIDASATVPDFLVSMNISAGAGASTWTQTQGTLPIYSYRITDATGVNTVISPWSSGWAGYSTTAGVFASVEMAGWLDNGAATSQVYDTKVTNPVYSVLTWTPSLPAGAFVTMRIRSSPNADMTGATTWSTALNGVNSPLALGALSNTRYVQFQAGFQAAPPYLTYPQVEDIKIAWPGDSALVELLGYYTLKPNYGQFRVLVDGQLTVKGLEVKLTVAQAYRGKTYSCSLNAEEKPRNTGK